MHKLLNPGLFHALERRFGKGQVEVVSPGCNFRTHAEDFTLREIRRRTDEAKRRRSRQLAAGVKPPPLQVMRMRMVVDESGEEYKFNCPYCSDDRQRCFVNHQWSLHKGSEKANLAKTGRGSRYPTWITLIQCFNEQCFSGDEGRENRKRLYEQVCEWILPGRLPEPRFRQSKSTLRQRKMEMPGRCISFEELCRRDPNHRALAYLVERGFDPLQLSEELGVCYCEESRYELATDRIIIPVYYREKLVGWQARRLQESGWEGKGPPKYWTSPGFRKSLYGYGLDDLQGAKKVVIVEGPTDKWRVGLHSLALFGKTLREASLLRRIDRVVHHNARIILLLDPEQDPVAKAKGQPHHIRKAYDMLAAHYGEDRVSPILLPPGKDPGGLEHDLLWEIIHEQRRLDPQEILERLGDKVHVS